MRHQFLILAFIVIVISLVEELLINGIVITVAIFYLKFYKAKKIALCLVFLITYQAQFIFKVSPILHDKKLVVEEVKTNYVIASTKNQKVILYNVSGVYLKDCIIVEGEYEVIKSNRNLFLFDFSYYMKKKGILYSMNVRSYDIYARSSSVQTKVYKYISNIKNEEVKSHYLKLFYKIDENRNDINYFMYMSGLHIQMIASYVASKVKKSKAIIMILSCIGLSFLFPIQFFLIRLIVFSVVNVLCSTFNKKDKLGIAIISLLVINPLYVFELGFVIATIFSLISNFQVKKLSKKLIHFIMFIPIQLYYFNMCNITSILFFSPILKVSTISFGISFLCLFFSPMHFVALWLSNISNMMIKFMVTPIMLVGHPNFFWFLIWILLFILLISGIRKNYILYFSLLVAYQIHMASLNMFGEVSFLDVGQGDSILIHEPMFGEVILIDVAGSLYKDIASDIIYPSLQARGIKHIDKVIISHEDYDHVGGLDQLSKMISIGEIIYDSDKIQTKYLLLQNLNTVEYDDENDSSQVLYTKIYGLNYLFMGDASKLVEEDIIAKYNQLRIDVLKVSHHGSNTASSDSFVQMIQPMISIISSGYKNRYKHPHKEVIDILNTYESNVFNTQEDGSYSIYFSKYLNFYKTGSKQFGIIKKVKK